MVRILAAAIEQNNDENGIIFSPAIAPFNWRGYWDFGAAALGDMGCHIMDATFNVLGQRVPEKIVDLVIIKRIDRDSNADSD